jgi:hypothetical protein
MTGCCGEIRLKVRLDLHVEKDQKEALFGLSRITGASLSELVRRALREYLHKGTAGR